MQLLFGVVPLAGYLFDYVTRIYTDLLARGNQAAVEFMPFVCSVAYIVFVLRVSAEERTRSQLEQTRNNLKLQVGQAVREISIMVPTRYFMSTPEALMSSSATLTTTSLTNFSSLTSPTSGIMMCGVMI